MTAIGDFFSKGSSAILASLVYPSTSEVRRASGRFHDVGGRFRDGVRHPSLPRSAKLERTSRRSVELVS